MVGQKSVGLNRCPARGLCALIVGRISGEDPLDPEEVGWGLHDERDRSGREEYAGCPRYNVSTVINSRALDVGYSEIQAQDDPAGTCGWSRRCPGR